MSGTRTTDRTEGIDSMPADLEPIEAPRAPGDPAARPDLDGVIAGTARLLELVQRSPVSRLSLAVGEIRWEIEASVPTVSTTTVQASGASAPTVTTVAVNAVEATAGHPVLAPLVGVFYSSPRPGAPPFARVGDRVAAGQQLAIVEAMKMLNEIVSDRAGIVREVHVQNEAIVEFGERLFTLEPV